MGRLGFNDMNYYQLSYDVIDVDKTPDRNSLVLKELVKTLLRINASCISRFVETTIMFLSDQDRSAVYKAIQQWADGQDVYYVLSQVQSAGKNEEGQSLYFFKLRENSSLQSTISEMCKQIDLGRKDD